MTKEGSRNSAHRQRLEKEHNQPRMHAKVSLEHFLRTKTQENTAWFMLIRSNVKFMSRRTHPGSSFSTYYKQTHSTYIVFNKCLVIYRYTLRLMILGCHLPWWPRLDNDSASTLSWQFIINSSFELAGMQSAELFSCMALVTWICTWFHIESGANEGCWAC